MMQTAKGSVLAALVALSLSACGNDDQPNLMNLRQQGNGPDEFGIVPPKPLEMPQDLAQLPEPTPGGSNITDATPHEDAIIALGGKPQAPATGAGAPAADGALVAAASRNGVQSDIRTALAEKDLDIRRKNNGRLLERLFGVNVYYRAYDDMWLDQQAELERWRAANAGNPSAPPEGAGE